MIYFYLPTHDIPPFKDLPTEKNINKFPNLFLSPSLNWTWRTYYHLSQSGFPCKLVDSLPDEGIIVSSACNLPIFFRPKPKQFMVSCVADSPPLFFAQCQIFQSSFQASMWQEYNIFPKATYFPHWPQPGLIKRSAERGDTFTNLSYFGAPNQLDLSLQSKEIIEKFRELGFTMNYNFQNYNDYSDVDCVFAIRQFKQNIVSHKPASKLINAWRAGVPAILGKEAAFQEQRHSDYDYIQVDSITELINASLQLRDDKVLRNRMVQEGIKRAGEFSVERITLNWSNFLKDEVPILYDKWCSLSWLGRNLVYKKQFTKRASLSLEKRIKRLNS